MRKIANDVNNGTRFALDGPLNNPIRLIGSGWCGSKVGVVWEKSRVVWL